ncbi:MAG: DUF5615 family PIN-like protein [Acidobacteria bacterium]|nr:DUF5615 family PIN-like protein [Acidobacteriota bacterium]
MSEIKYLLDEHVNPRLRKALKRSAPDIVVWRVGDPGAPQLSAPDPEILLWCEERGFSLVTNNRESMPVHLQKHLAEGRHVPGIFTLNPNLTIGETAEELVLIWGASEAEEYADQLNYLPLSS